MENEKVLYPYLRSDLGIKKGLNQFRLLSLEKAEFVVEALRIRNPG